MRTYVVNLKPDAENTFQSIMQFDPEVVIEIEDFENNVYSIETAHSVDHLLNAEPGVESYRFVFEYGEASGRGK